MVKNLPAKQETQIPSLGSEDPLEKERATSSRELPGEFRGQRSLAGYSPWGCKESDMTYLASKQQQHSLSYSQKMSYTSIIASHQI